MRISLASWGVATCVVTAMAACAVPSVGAGPLQVAAVTSKKVTTLSEPQLMVMIQMNRAWSELLTAHESALMGQRETTIANLVLARKQFELLPPTVAFTGDKAQLDSFVAALDKTIKTLKSDKAISESALKDRVSRLEKRLGTVIRSAQAT